MPTSYSIMQSCLSKLPFCMDIHILFVNQPFDNLKMPTSYSIMQSCLSTVVFCMDIHILFVNQPFDHVQMPTFCSNRQSCQSIRAFCIDISVIPEQPFSSLQISFLRCVVQGRTTVRV